MKSHEFLTEWVENPAFDVLWKKYVPSHDEAKTEFGEAVRALGRLEYDYYNNGYGNARETEEVGSDDYSSDDDDDGGYDYDVQGEDIGFNPYYQDLWDKLNKFVVSNNPTPSDVKAVDALDRPAWESRPEPQFEQAIGILKRFLVSREPKKAKLTK